MYNFALNKEIHYISMHLDTTPVKLGKYDLSTHLRFMEKIGLISSESKKDFSVIVEILLDLTNKFYSASNANLFNRSIINFKILMGRADKRFNSSFARKIKSEDLRNELVTIIKNGASNFNIIRGISSIGKYVRLENGNYILNVDKVDTTQAFVKEFLQIMDACHNYLRDVIGRLQSTEMSNGTHYSSTIAYDLLWYSGYTNMKPSVFVDYREYPKAGILYLEDIGQIY